MNALQATFRYELRKSVTAGRVLWWFVLAALPVAITLLSRWVQNQQAKELRPALDPDTLDSFWSLLLYVTVPCVSCAMSALLTAGPAVATELEQRSWIYLATRPHGITWLLLGKFLVASVWAFTAATAGTLIAIALINAPHRTQILSGILSLAALSAPAYSAAYLLLGAIFPRRSMVFCVMYTGGVEVILGSFPAIINRITVQFRLRSLLVQWLPLDDTIRNSPAMEYAVGTSSPTSHIVGIATLTLAFVIAAITLTRFREFTSATETDL